MSQQAIRLPAICLKNRAGQLLLQTEPMEFEPGETVAVTGPSGAGKSLFLNALFGWSGSAIDKPLSVEKGAYLMIQDPSRGLTPSLTIGGHFREVPDLDLALHIAEVGRFSIRIGNNCSASGR